MKLLKVTLILLLQVWFAISCFAQKSDHLIDEELILSFKTEQGKSIYFYKHKKTDIIILKVLNEQQVEFQFPENLHSKETVFNYSYYLRGGGSMNEGMDLNYVYFVFQHLKYVLYETSHATDQQSNIGLKIINLQTSEVVDYKATKGSVKGTLLSLRDSNKVIKGDELFD